MPLMCTSGAPTRPALRARTGLPFSTRPLPTRPFSRFSVDSLIRFGLPVVPLLSISMATPGIGARYCRWPGRSRPFRQNTSVPWKAIAIICCARASSSRPGSCQSSTLATSTGKSSSATSPHTLSGEVNGLIGSRQQSAQITPLSAPTCSGRLRHSRPTGEPSATPAADSKRPTPSIICFS
ncbi:hypothetical protein D3C78_1090230 [compost metagenome]